MPIASEELRILPRWCYYYTLSYRPFMRCETRSGTKVDCQPTFQPSIKTAEADTRWLPLSSARYSTITTRHLGSITCPSLLPVLHPRVLGSASQQAKHTHQESHRVSRSIPDKDAYKTPCTPTGGVIQGVVSVVSLLRSFPPSATFNHHGEKLRHFR